MFFARPSSIRLALLVSLLGILSACSGNRWIEERLAPDPKLEEKTQEVNSSSNNEPRKLPSVKLLDRFPQAIPLYPTAQLLYVETEAADRQGKTRWGSSQSSDRILSYYQNQFQSNTWEIERQETDAAQKTIVASNDNWRVRVSILPQSVKSGNSGNQTEFVIDYQRSEKIVGVPTKDPDRIPTTSDPANNQQSQPLPTNSESTLSFSDLGRIPQQLDSYVEDVVALGILTSEPDNKQTTKLFEPNKIITRREYARWLVAVNNRIYAHRPGQQIRLAAKTEQPVFKDVPSSDRDFAVIQGLAEAGIIPSSLTGDSTALLFRPDAPLTRENLVLWKVPLDTRRSLPSASIEAVKETWGFQDTAKIAPKVLRSLYADFQNGEKSNVRRVFGYTILFQPKKTVTRAEAAAALWYFGFQGEGISAKEAAKLKN